MLRRIVSPQFPCILVSRRRAVARLCASSVSAWFSDPSVPIRVLSSVTPVLESTLVCSTFSRNSLICVLSGSSRVPNSFWLPSENALDFSSRIPAARALNWFESASFAVSSSAIFSSVFFCSEASKASSSLMRAACVRASTIPACNSARALSRSVDMRSMVFSRSVANASNPARAAESECICAISRRVVSSEFARSPFRCSSSVFAAFAEKNRYQRVPASTAKTATRAQGIEEDITIPLRQIYAFRLVHFLAAPTVPCPPLPPAPCFFNRFPPVRTFTPRGPAGRLEDSGPCAFLLARWLSFPAADRYGRFAGRSGCSGPRRILLEF